jgi:hypothetical protein
MLDVLGSDITQAVIRGIVLLVGLIFSVMAIIAFTLARKQLERVLQPFSRIRRLNVIVQGGLAVHMAVGAWLQHPLGWYAALAVAVLNPVEALIRHRTIFTGEKAVVYQSVVEQIAWLLLLALLLTHDGRAAFGVASSRRQTHLSITSRAPVTELANKRVLPTGGRLAEFSLALQVQSGCH